jgi:hypothetical protein
MSVVAGTSDALAGIRDALRISRRRHCPHCQGYWNAPNDGMPMIKYVAVDLPADVAGERQESHQHSSKSDDTKIPG